MRSTNACMFTGLCKWRADCTSWVNSTKIHIFPKISQFTTLNTFAAKTHLMKDLAHQQQKKSQKTQCSLKTSVLESGDKWEHSWTE